MLDNESLLTRGPLALFYGGPEIIPHLSTNPFQSSNVPLLIIIALTIGIKIFLETYKKMVYRQGLAYGQQLGQTMINSLRNVYGPVSLILWFLGISGALLLHQHLSKKSRRDKDLEDLDHQSIAGPLAIGAVFQLVLCIPFIINPGLR